MRQTNIEALRICAMFLVLLVHTAYFSMGSPTKDCVIASPMEWFGISIVQALSVVCVNIFVLISGWFRIKLKVKSLFSLLFQAFFFLISSYIVMSICGMVSFSILGFIKCFAVIGSFWFVDAYLLLMLLSPVLNAFIINSNRRTYKIVLVLFFLSQTVFGCTGLITAYEAGYSFLSFLGLYLLAAYFRLYQPRISSLGVKAYLGTYLLLAAFIAAISIVMAYIPIVSNHYTIFNYTLFTYNNPIVIVEACALFFFFEKLGKYFTPHTHSSLLQMSINKLIILVAPYSFAAYLFHANPYALSVWYKPSVQNLYQVSDNTLINITSILFFVIFVYAFAIIIDRVRLWLWKRIWDVTEPTVRILISRFI